MPSATDIEALDNIANEIKLFREMINAGSYEYDPNISIALANLQESLKDTTNSSAEIFKGIERALSEIHNDARSLTILKDFWEQMTFYVAEKTSSHVSSDAYKADLLAKGGYYTELVQNKDLVINRALPFTELSILSVFTTTTPVLVNKLIKISNLLSTIGIPVNSKLTLSSVAAGPNSSVVLDTDNSQIIFNGSTIGTTYFTYTAISNLGSSITGIANITITA